MKKNTFLLTSIFLFITALHQPALADEKLDVEIAALQHRWAKANYNTNKDAQEAAFETLIEEAHLLTLKHKNAPEAQIWEGITNASYAKVKGGLGALKFAEKSRDLLLEAEKTNPEALQGAAYTTLGSLFYKVPSWPIGFGDKKKAQIYLEKALSVNPTGIDPNFFYADFLSHRGEYAKAVAYYEKALAAPARIGREDADAGRRIEVETGLLEAKSKL